MPEHDDFMDSQAFCQILGIRFFMGSALETLDQIREGGLVVVPSAPTLKDLPDNRVYREALLNADMAITDSALMVLLWNLMHRTRIARVSGLAYFKVLVDDNELRTPGNTLWVMASEESADVNLRWLASRGIQVAPQDVYIAPIYGGRIEDPALLAQLKKREYRHVVLTVGGGIQECLGSYLKKNLVKCPAIHCIGAAIAFLSGDQVYIPGWADRTGLGWLLRCLWKPTYYGPRYWRALKLVSLMLRYRANLPPLREAAAEHAHAA